jgi:hypothetical protein
MCVVRWLRACGVQCVVRCVVCVCVCMCVCVCVCVGEMIFYDVQ